MKIQRQTRLLCGGVNEIVMLVAKGCLLFLTISVIYGVGRRALGADSPSWIFELSTLLMLPLTFLVAAPIAARRGHVAIGVLVDPLPAPIGDAIYKIGVAVSTVFLVFLTYQSVMRFQEIVDSRIVTGSANIPHWPVAISVPIGLTAMTLQLIYDFIFNSKVLPAEKEME